MTVIDINARVAVFEILSPPWLNEYHIANQMSILIFACIE